MSQQAQMSQHSERHANRAAALSARLLGAIAALLLLGVLQAAPALADFEQVTTFAESGAGEHRLNAVQGLAVNYTGAGGVPAGAVYSVAHSNTQVTRWSPTGEFTASWTSNGNNLGIAVDQSTGYVYVRREGYVGSPKMIQVFSADGSHLVAQFGEWGGGESVEESPEKIHLNTRAIAVDSSGAVYVGDNGPRAMVWRPQSPGDYEHYVYAGRAEDVPLEGVSQLAVDDAGNLYDAEGKGIAEIVPGEAASKCEYPVKDIGLIAMTVDPTDGRVFYWDERTPGVIHELGACDEASGTFTPSGEFAVLPQPRGTLEGLGFNPSYRWGGTHPPGALYGAETFYGLGYIFAPAEAFPPQVESESVSATTATTATLGARINPKGFPTEYVFQYLKAAEYDANEPTERFAGAVEAPAGGASLPAAQKPLAAAATPVGLMPDTEYRFRVIATSHCEPSSPEALCQTPGEALRFRTFEPGAVGLPDGRAWELVSPALKQGGEAFPLEPVEQSGMMENPGTTGGRTFPRQSSPDGGAVAYAGFPFSSSEGAAIFNEYVSRRTPSGWRTTILAPSALNENGGSYAGFDPSLHEAVFGQSTPSLTALAPSEYPNLYTQPTADPAALSPLVDRQPPNRAGSEFAISYAGGSDDFSHVFFEADDALTGATPFAPAATDPGQGAPGDRKYDLYEWNGGELRLVNVAPGNATVIPGARFGALGGTDVPHAISADGSHAFFTGESGRLYVRIDGERTLEVHDPGAYLTASEDGSKVLLSDGCLYDLEEEACTDLTEGRGGYQGLAGSSDDLSHIYFVDTAVLTGGEENEYGAAAAAGESNLYSWYEGGLAFVATLEDVKLLKIEGGALRVKPFERGAEASPNGRWLAFVSQLPLTGYDNNGPACQRNNVEEYVAGRCAEAFLYDSTAGRLRCASCNPTDAAPLGSSRLPWVRQNNNESIHPSFKLQPRYLLDSGRLYFDSLDALSPLDTNRAVEGVALNGEPAHAGAVSAEDVYEWEPQGVGGCMREAGCVALLSGGREPQDSSFLAVDETGKNVFFATREQLVPEDRDGLFDVYDAREGGGFTPPERQVECQGEACQPAVAAPNAPSLASSAFRGAGNVTEPSTAASRCRAAARRSRILSRRVKNLRRGAARIADPKKTRRLRRSAAHYAGAARESSGHARRCRARLRHSRRAHR